MLNLKASLLTLQQQARVVNLKRAVFSCSTPHTNACLDQGTCQGLGQNNSAIAFQLSGRPLGTRAMALRRGAARLFAQALRQQGQCEAPVAQACGPSASALDQGYAHSCSHRPSTIKWLLLALSLKGAYAPGRLRWGVCARLRSLQVRLCASLLCCVWRT